MKLTSRDIVEILTTVKELGFRRFHARIGELTLEVDTREGADRRSGPETNDTRTVAPDPADGTQASARSFVEPEPEPGAGMATMVPREGVVAVFAPMSGIFYRSPAPGAPPFVEVGSRVESDDTVCIVEIMKLFNSIPAGVAGTVVDIVVENEGRVEAGQPLLWIESKEEMRRQRTTTARGRDLEMNGRESELTYREVATVLALLDGWGRGRIHFRNGEFEVDAFVAEASGTPAPARTLSISSPSVGLFHAARRRHEWPVSRSKRGRSSGTSSPSTVPLR